MIPIYKPGTGNILLLLLLLAQPTFASDERSLTPHVAEYKVKIKFLGGKMKTEVIASENGYTVQSVLRASGFARLFARGNITEKSSFIILQDGVWPVQYSSRDTISKKDKSVDLLFDWQQKTVTGSAKGESVQLELQHRVFDRVSIQYELMFDLLNSRVSEEYLLIDGNEIKLLEVSILGTKNIKVPYGEFEAIGIQHKKKNSSRITTLWCVKELDYLPVLIEQHRDGKQTVRAVLTKYQPLIQD